MTNSLIDRLESADAGSRELEWRFIYNALFPYRPMDHKHELITVERDPERPWILNVTEALETNAPAHARPWCCYISTVIFYENPWRVDASDKRAWARHDEVESKIHSDDILQVGEDQFQLYGGKCIYRDGWKMTWKARRIAADRRILKAHALQEGDG